MSMLTISPTTFILLIAAVWLVVVFGTGGSFDAEKENPDHTMHWR